MSGLAAALVGMVVLVVAVVTTTVRIATSETSRVHGRIRAALGNVRMLRMLRRREVDVEAFIRTADAGDIRAQISNCATCPNVTQCDETLADGASPVEDYAFCPNSDAIALAYRRIPIAPERVEESAAG